MKPNIFRPGTNQNERHKAALQPEYVSVEERSTHDILRFARDYAKSVRYYDLDNNKSGFWSAFLNFDDDELEELAIFADNPEQFKNESQILDNFSQPHLALLLTFVHLLKYPKKSFASLTGKHLDFYYRKFLSMEELGETPDQVHVILKLAREVNERLVEKGRLLSAGKDATGIDLHYATQDNIVVNKAAVADIKTIHFKKAITDLKYVHLAHDRGDQGFERILCLVLDRETLPPYRNEYGTELEVNAKFLRTVIYERIKGKERDELATNDADYIFDSLCFPYLKDFWTCLDVFYREMNRGYVGVTFPEDIEWEEVYTLLESVHEERIAKKRRKELKDVHQTHGFEPLMEFAFGEPEPWNLLFAMPRGISSLDELAASETEATRKYVENHLCMTVDDFRTIMRNKDNSLGADSDDEVHSLLEKAWTKKRNYQYPSIGSEIVEGYYADTIFESDNDKEIGRFSTFGKSATAAISESIQMGFAVNSPLLLMNEGQRCVELILSCQQGSFPREELKQLLADNDDIFNVSLTTAKGWQKSNKTRTEAGKFITKPPLRSFNVRYSRLACDTQKHKILDESSTDWYVLFENEQVYKIVSYDFLNNKIQLESVYLRYATGSTKLITSLVPRTFVDPLRGDVVINNYQQYVIHDQETFNDYHEGRYLVDSKGSIFFIKSFISASELEVRFCGGINKDKVTDLMIINRVWESIEPEFASDDPEYNISDLKLSEMVSQDAEFKFKLNDRKLAIEYPVDSTGAPTVNDLMAAWEAWKDAPSNHSGRFEITRSGTGSEKLSPIVKQMELTGEIVKRYDSPDPNGICVTYRGRPTKNVYLIIKERSSENKSSHFLISGDTLIITPGISSFTANQIAADWSLWIAQNNSGGFSVKSKDNRIWKQTEIVSESLVRSDKRIKYTELKNLYGNGIRVTFSGSEYDQPSLLFKENEIDLFEFQIVDEQKLIIKYPFITESSAHDLFEEWQAWKTSEINDSGKFDIKQLGDGLWKIESKTIKELKATSDQYMECTVDDIGVIALFHFTGEYKNAVIALNQRTDTHEFSFQFNDLDPGDGTLPIKQLTISFPKLPTDSDTTIQEQYQIQHVQKLLSTWNRLADKQGFILLREEEDALWSTEDLAGATPTDFLKDLSYVSTIHPDGFKAKFRPDAALYANGKIPGANVVIEENNADEFDFSLLEDHPNNLKILYVKYPTEKKNRTIENLLAAWTSKTTKTGGIADKLTEFNLVQMGTGKWIVSSEIDVPLTMTATTEMSSTDEVNLRFFEYHTKDVNGFTINYSGPVGMGPTVHLLENSADAFDIDVQSVYDASDQRYYEDELTIKYPSREDKRLLVDLFKEWNKFKNSSKDLSLGFEIIDTSQVVTKRSKSQMHQTGDQIRSFKVGGLNGLRVTHIGNVEGVDLDISEIVDFTDQDIGKSILWSNGQIFNITSRIDRNMVTIEETGEIDLKDNIYQYQPDAICLNALKFSAEFDSDFPAIVPFNDNQMSREPGLRVLFNNSLEFNGKSSEALYFEYFKSIVLERVDLKVDVKGISEIKTRGNVAMINPQNPYYPFGTFPEKSSRFFFANREICEKKLDSLNLNLKWGPGELTTQEGLPDMETRYAAYSRCGLSDAATIRNSDFKVDLRFKDRRSWIRLSDEKQELFSHSLSYSDTSAQTYQGKLFEDDEDLPKDPLDWRRYYKLELCDQGFLKDLSEDVSQELANASNRLLIAESDYNAAKQEILSVEASIRSAKITEAEARAAGDTYIPPIIPEARELPLLPENDKDRVKQVFYEPYSPYLESMTVDYSASSSVSIENTSEEQESGKIPVEFFRFHPFGYSDMGDLGKDDYLLPHYDKQGYLMIGVKDIHPLQSLSLLVQMVSGSGEASVKIPEISWSYLSANRWIPFQVSDVLMDTTFGLQDTGIIRFNIPEDTTFSNTVLPPNRCWIRAEAENNISAVPDIIDIRTQALLAEYVNKNNDPEHLESPLIASSISEMVERDSNIREVNQPYSSFKGKKKEDPFQFYTRVSERLKHKHRAINLKDYENLILSEFSEIYKVKCLPQGELKLLTQDSEGEVVIVVILKNKNATPFFPLKPKTPANILGDIEKYISQYTPPLVRVKVVNPRFEEVQYRLAVKFTENHDFGFYINKLNDDIMQFLSPWAYSKDAEISFGSSVYSSSIINYIENTDYVDYVANFTLLKQVITHEEYTEVIPLFLTEDNAATAKYPDSVLVSAEGHIIDVIRTDLYDAGAFRGIGYMRIGTDFWINRPGPVFAVGIGEMELEAMPVARYAFKNIKIEMTIEGVVEGELYTKPFEGKLSENDSDTIWFQLLEYAYIDDEGKVLPKTEPYDAEFEFTFGTESLETYIKNKGSRFDAGEEPVLDFDLDITASDFLATADQDLDLTFQIKSIDNFQAIENQLLEIMKFAQGFTGLSQYPFLVY